MRDLFFIVNEIEFASYADDNTPFVSGDRPDWFSNNQMKANLISVIYLGVVLFP